MIEKIFIFIIFLGPLVFFHELGHFLFARFFGVRVEVFSIGFGPKLFKFVKGDTQYALSLIPLGGYVKMYGDDPLTKDDIPEEDRDKSFTFKGKWARFWFVMGGPLANFILAFFIFYSLLITGEKVPEIKVGSVPSDSKIYEMGVRTGDVLKAMNGRPITGPSDIVVESTDGMNVLTVDRGGKDVSVKVALTGEKFFEELIKYPPYLLKNFMVGKDHHVYGISDNKNFSKSKSSLPELAFSEANTFYLFKAEKNAGEHKVKDDSFKTINIETGDYNAFLKSLSNQGFKTLDLVVKSVNMKSPADTAGVKGGDIIKSIDGREIFNFLELKELIQKSDKNGVTIGLLRNEKALNLKLVPETKKIGETEVKLIGVHSAGEYVGPKYINTPSKNVIEAFVPALSRTWDSMVKTVEGFKKLITAEVSLKNIGGPLAIGKVASDSFGISLSYFFQLMALISVNLGIINLFPIPVLDGGHILFIFFEILNGGPVSRKKMEIAQQFGLSLLLLLMIGAIFNDFSKFF